VSQKLIFDNLDHDEFEELLLTLPRKILIFPISARPKQFAEYIKGYRPNKINESHIKTIYNKLVFSREDPKLVEYLDNSIKDYLAYIDKQIGEELTACLVKEFYATEELERFVDVFLEKKIELNVYLYLKMKDIQLPEDSIGFLRETTADKKKRREIGEEIAKNLKKQYVSLLQQKDEEISRLHKECSDFEDEVEEYIEKNRSQAEKIDALSKDLKLLENKYADCLKENELLQTNSLGLKRLIQQIEENNNTLRQELEGKQAELADKEKQIASLGREIERQKALNVRNIPEIIESNPVLKEKYLQFIRKEWLEDQDEQRELVRQELAAETAKLEQARREYAKIGADKASLEQEILSLVEEKNRLEKELAEFQELFQAKIKGARTEISSFLAEVAVYQGAVGGIESLDSAIYRFADVIPSSPVENIASLNDLIYLLEENLQKAGIMKKYIGLVAPYTVYCWITGRPLLLFGSQARAFANALSTLTCSLPADVLTLPTAFKYTAELIKAVEESKSSVVLIENAVLGCDESVYLPLIKQRSNKMLLFSVDFAEQMALLPQSMFHFLNLLGLDAVSSGTQRENYTFGQVTTKLILPKPSEEVWLAQRKAMKKLSQVSYLTPTYIQQRTNCLAGLSGLNGQALTAFLVSEFIPYFAAQGKQEELETLVEELKLPESELRLLEPLLERKWLA